MKNKAKRFFAALLAAAMLLSAAACSKVSDGKTEENGSENVAQEAFNNKEAEAKREKIKQKAAEIIATLEVGKTYDEIPLTAKKLGVERFKVEETRLDANGNVDTYNEKFNHYADLTDVENIIYSKLGRVGYLKTPFWIVGNDYEISKLYIQFGDEFKDVPQNDIHEVADLGDYITSYIEDCGYDVWSCDDNIDELDFVYLGKETVEGYSETLAFEAIDGVRYHKYNIDPETGFCVMYHHNSGIEELYDGISYYFYMSKVEIEPAEQTPDFDSKLIDDMAVNRDYDKTLEMYIDAVCEQDVETVFELSAPTVEEPFISIWDISRFLNDDFTEDGKNVKMEISNIRENGSVQYADLEFASYINGSVTETKLLKCDLTVNEETTIELIIEAYNLQEYGWRFATSALY